MTDVEIHPTHDPEPDGQRLYRGGVTCRRCCWFVAWETPTFVVTPAGVRPCSPRRVVLR